MSRGAMLRAIRRFGTGRAATGFVVSLIASAALIVAIVVDASRATREQHATAARLTRDYGRYAAWSVQRVAWLNTLQALNSEFRGVGASGVDGGERLPPLSVVVSTTDSL